jgi:hypothetical protein
LSIDELVDIALETDYAQDFDLDVDLDSVDVNDVVPSIVKLNDAKIGLLIQKFLSIFVFVWNYKLLYHTIYIA